MITKEQVADLRVGDEIRVTGWDDNLTVEGVVSEASIGDSLWLGQYIPLTPAVGAPWMAKPNATLTVLQKAARPVYVNHARAEHVPGDVVCAAAGGRLMWVHRVTQFSGKPWMRLTDMVHQSRIELPTSLRLLVDGETIEAVR